MLKKFKLQVTSLAIALTMLAGGATVMASDDGGSYDTISEGQTITVTIDGSKGAIYTFTPEKTGTYFLFSDSEQTTFFLDEDEIEEGMTAIDPGVYVYEADPATTENYSASDDDGYYGYNFFLIDEFEQGKTYYFLFRDYNGASVSYDVTLLAAFDIGFDASADFVDFILVDPKQEFTLYEKAINDLVPVTSGKGITNADKNGLYFKNGVERNTWVAYMLSGEVYKFFDVFVMGEKVDGTLESGQTVHIENDYEGMGDKEIEDNIPVPLEEAEEESILQMIYSFTPEKDGTVKISITNVEDGLPAVALFGSDYSFIGKIVGYDFDELDEYYVMELEVADGEGDSSEDGLVLETSLEGGKVYYVAIPLSSPGFDLHSEFDVTLDYEEKKEEEKNDDDINNNDNNNDNNNNDNNNNNNNNDNNNNDNNNSDKDVKDAEAFVKRLYEVVFGREADPAGLKYWVDKINNGATGADVVKEFLNSPEYNGKDLNDEDFVKSLYNIFFGRVPGKDEIKFWVDSLKDVSRDTVINNFINTTEWDDFCKSYGIESGARFPINDPSDVLDFARRLYTCCLEREPDDSGLKFWNDALVNHKMTGTQVAKEFFWSAEFLSFKTSDKEFITRLYRTMMGREPEPEGFEFWMNDLKVESREQVFMGFATSPEFKGVCEKCGISWM